MNQKWLPTGVRAVPAPSQRCGLAVGCLTALYAMAVVIVVLTLAILTA